MEALHILLAYVWNERPENENNENSNCDYYFTDMQNEIFLFQSRIQIFISSSLQRQKNFLRPIFAFFVLLANSSSTMLPYYCRALFSSLKRHLISLFDCCFCNGKTNMLRIDPGSNNKIQFPTLEPRNLSPRAHLLQFINFFNIPFFNVYTDIG